MAEEKIEYITCLRNTRANGKSVFRGKQYRVPDEINEKDAQTLIVMGRAVAGKIKLEAEKTKQA